MGEKCDRFSLAEYSESLLWMNGDKYFIIISTCIGLVYEKSTQQSHQTLYLDKSVHASSLKCPVRI